MLILKKKNYKILHILLVILFVPFVILFLNTPGLKGDFEQSLRIFLKQPTLLKDSSNDEDSFLVYLNKTYYGFQNKLFNKSNFDTIKIDVPFDKLLILREERKKALTNKKLINPTKVLVRIFHDNKKYIATARLKGDLSEHWGNIKQWSLRIKLKNNKTIYSMNEFSISIHSERDFPYNFLKYNIMKRYQLISPRYRTAKINFNGEDWGLMLVEEQFSSPFYAINRIKEAPIFKMTNENDFSYKILAKGNLENIDDINKWQGKIETRIYNENRIRKKTNIPGKKTNETLISIFKSIQESIVLNDQKYLSKLNKFQNLESFAKVVAINSVFGDYHSTGAPNSRYYLNPYDLKIEPILTDPSHSEINEKFFSIFPDLYKNIFKLEDFQKIYLKTIFDIEKNFYLIENDIQIICKPYGKNCFNLIDLKMIKKNINFLIQNKEKIFEKIEYTEKKLDKKKVFNTKNIQNINKKKLYLRAFYDGELKVYNLTSENIKLKKVILRKEKDGCINSECILKEISIDQNLLPSDNQKIFIKKIKIEINKKFNFIELVYYDEKNNAYSNVQRIEQAHLKADKIFQDFELFRYEFINKNGNEYIIPKGKYLIKEPLIIPAGNNLKISGGTSLAMSEKAYIFVENGIINFDGDKNSKIEIKSLEENKKWKGIYVNSKNIENKSSNLSFVKISNTSYFDNEKIQLTGAINFINSKANLSNTEFFNSSAEDAVNFVNSEFEVKNSIFQKINSDAIDSDFSNGKISMSNFSDIKGDAIDTSGSKIEISGIIANEIGDKAISVGEESSLKIENIKISNSQIGIATKDSSRVTGSNISIQGCKLYDFAVYQKKHYFSGGYMNLKNVSSCNMHLVQFGSKLKINDETIEAIKFDTKKLYN